MYGYIYKTIFPAGSFGNPEESFYIGQKKSEKLVETYYGSGVIIFDYFKSKGLNSRNCNPKKAAEIGIRREILAEANSFEELNQLEYEFILKYIGSVSCINLAQGGRMPNMTKELRQKISEKTKEAMKKDEVYDKYIKAHRKYYIENKEKISAEARERVYKTKNFDKMNIKNREKNIEQWADETIHEQRRAKMAAKTGKKVLCIETGQVFDSVNNAQKVLGISNHILSVCYGKRKTAGGLHFMFVD